MGARIWMRPDAAAVLVVRGYRFTCPQCQASNLEETVVDRVACQTCGTALRITAVCFCSGDKALFPGIAPRVLSGAEPAAPTIRESVLVAVGYVWLCGECDPWGEKPHLAAHLVDRVTCPRCRACFPVIEICHRTESVLRARRLLASSTARLPARAASDPPQAAPFDLTEWSIYHYKGEPK